MFIYVAVFFGILAILAALLLVGLTCMGWFGMTGKVKEFVNSYLGRQFDQQYRNHERVAINTQCYICIQRTKSPVIATCNHSYCATCILRYIESKGGRQVECPACRQKICVLFRQFDPTNQQQRKLKDKISQFNFKNSQQPGIWRSITQLPNVLRNAPSLISRDGIRFLLTNPRVKVILIMLVYTLSPIDFLPEGFLGPLGLFDDAFVTLNIFREVSGLLISFAQEEQARNRGRRRDQERQRFAA